MQRRLDPLPPSSTYALFAEDEHSHPLEDRETVSHKTLHFKPSPLSTTFFGTRNVDVIQLAIHDRVHAATNHRISRQSDEQLLILMRYIYVEYASNAAVNTDIGKEIAHLNTLVVQHAVPDIIANLAQYMTYLQNASRLPSPIPRGEQTSMRGTKTTSMFRSA